jgi:hypothetical protein
LREGRISCTEVIEEKILAPREDGQPPAICALASGPAPVPIISLYPFKVGVRSIVALLNRQINIEDRAAADFADQGDKAAMVADERVPVRRRSLRNCQSDFGFIVLSLRSP